MQLSTLTAAIAAHQLATEQTHAALEAMRTLVAPIVFQAGYRIVDVDSVDLVKIDGVDICLIGIDFEWGDGEKDYRYLNVPLAVIEVDDMATAWHAHTVAEAAKKEAERLEAIRQRELAQLQRLRAQYPDAG